MTTTAARPRHPTLLPPGQAGLDADDLSVRFHHEVVARAGHRYNGLRIGVVGSDGVVLSGRADCFYAKQVAQHVATVLTGLPVLINQIFVAKPRVR